MKKYHTDSDGGSFLFGNKDFSFLISNNYGDCENTVLVFKTDEEFKEYCVKKYGTEGWHRAFKWQTTLAGKFNLYSYDCSRLDDEDIVAKFDGKYSVYLRSADYEYPVLAIVRR